MIGLLQKIFGSRNQRLLKRYQKTVAVINALEPEFQALSDEALRAKTEAFRQRASNGEALDALLPEGKIAEMRTGEGKTLVATLAAYLNALSGQGVHIVTVNDYLAQRDAEWM